MKEIRHRRWVVSEGVDSHRQNHLIEVRVLSQHERFDRAWCHPVLLRR
jgi:hypothetical protein